METNVSNNLKEVAVYYDYVPNYFYVVKSTTPDKFNYIRNLDKNNFKKAFELYRKKMDTLKAEVIDIYFYLQDKSLISTFGLYAKEHNLFSHKNSLSNCFSKVLFTNRIGFKIHKTYIKYKKIPSLFEQFKKDKLLHI